MPQPIIDIHAAWKTVRFTAHEPAWRRHAAVAELERVHDAAVVAEFSVDDPAHWRAYQQSITWIVLDWDAGRIRFLAATARTEPV